MSNASDGAATSKRARQTNKRTRGAATKEETLAKRKKEPPSSTTTLARTKRRKGNEHTLDSAAGSTGSNQPAGHRPVTSCTHCRQHKIKCNASERFPAQCSRCERMGLKCEIDPQFRPKKGSQIQSLKNDVDELRSKIEFLTRNEKLIAQVLQKHVPNQIKGNNNGSFNNENTDSNTATTNLITVNHTNKISNNIEEDEIHNKGNHIHSHNNNSSGSSSSGNSSSINISNSNIINRIGDTETNINSNITIENIGNKAAANARNINGRSTTSPKTNNSGSPTLIAKTHLQTEPTLLSLHTERSNSTPLINDSALHKSDLNPALKAAIRHTVESPAQFTTPTETKLTTKVNTSSISYENINNKLSNVPISEFNLGDVKISIGKASELHERFIKNYLPFLPIMISNSCEELYQQSQLLFWTVMLTACLSDPDPTLYNSLSSLIKQLAIETCWIRTPRSTHIVQSLLILGTWPLPNQKVLDDCSYRFVCLAKSLSLQLGLHRGKFMTEFTRTQVTLPDAEKWRSRTWLAVFFSEQFWSSNLGLPPSLQTDFILEDARIDQSLPKNFRCFICLSIFQAKLVNIMGLNVNSPDGLMEPKNRAISLHILERELERLKFKLQIDDLVVEIYYLYVKLMICLFSFLPETPSEDQSKYITIAFHSATRIVTIISKLLENKQLTEYPIYVRHSVTTAALVLFRLHLTSYLSSKFVDSARQSVVTVHRLFRNMLAAWKDVENDISRTATVLEKLNYVIITHPELFKNDENESIIARMRSHLTGSLFYDLVWNIHEARRRTLLEKQQSEEEDHIIGNDFNLKRNSNGNGIGNNNHNNNNIDNFVSKKDKSKKKNGDQPLPLPFYNQITKDDFTAITTTTPNGTTVTKLVPTDQAISNAKLRQEREGLKEVREINGIPIMMLEATGAMGNASKPISNKSSRTNLKNFTPSLFKSSSAIGQYDRPNLARSTSLNAGARGLIPPPLFPSTTSASVSVSPSPSTAKMITPSASSTAMSKNAPIQRKSSLGKIETPIKLEDNAPLGFDNIFDANFGYDKLTPSPAGFTLPQPVQPTSNNGLDQVNFLRMEANNVTSTSQSPTSSDVLNDVFIDSIFQQQQQQQQLAGEGEDDLLGWFDMNMDPEF